MSTVAFDTYAQVKQLVQTGVPEAQAEAIINAVAGATALPDVSKLATKMISRSCLLDLEARSRNSGPSSRGN